ncbi:MAG: pyridoxal phosphate-dependent aminotransferase [Lachnospiraceae bacterium]|nr:pyridoxal phosphate-dependent aminotransferase [Lachnospiraceae bacterium]
MQDRFDFLRKSEIREMSIECDRAGGINLSQGICDFMLEDILLDSAYGAMKDGFNHYTRHDGEEILRRAIAKKSKHYNGITADEKKNIIITCGATGALFCVCTALFSPGDEIILFEPFYGYHEYTLLSLGMKPVYVKLSPPKWEICLEELEKKITSRTKAIIINTPLNPTGKVFTKEELEKLSMVCKKHDLLAITDEIYEYILYDGLQHVSPASIRSFEDRVITISGYSKTFSITGWRIGYCICPERFAQKIGYIADLLYVCAPAPLQIAVAKAIEYLDDSFYEKMREKFEKKRKMICDTLTQVNLTPIIPQGAYYVMADISTLPGRTGKERVMYLLEKTGVAAVPGEAFFHNAQEGYRLARFCFAKDDDVLSRACESLKKIIK